MYDFPINVGNFDTCDVTLNVYPHWASLKIHPHRASLKIHPHRASLKNMPGHSGNRTYDLWNTSPMLCLSYTARSVRVCDILELSLVPSKYHIL